MKATRQAFGESLAKLGEKHQQIVVLDADLSKSTKSEIFAKKFPDRFFEMGIAEANLIGTSAGLAFMGKIPFACSFGCFLTGRYDIIRLSVAYSQANVRLVGTHAGVGIGDDGHSQMGLEDISLMRALPTMGVFQPMDAIETEHLMQYLVETWKGPAYLRLTRQNLPTLYPEGMKFEPGKLVPVLTSSSGSSESTKSHNGILFLGSGAGTHEAFKAAKLLETQGKPCSVYNVHCLKPFDANGLRSILKNYRLVVTVEDHSVIGGLGSVVEECLAALPSHPQLVKVGVQDLFGESGEPAELYEKFGISAEQIAKKINSVI